MPAVYRAWVEKFKIISPSAPLVGVTSYFLLPTSTPGKVRYPYSFHELTSLPRVMCSVSVTKLVMFMCGESMWHLFFALPLLSGTVFVASAFFSCY